MNAVIYSRVSTVGKGQDPENQTRDMRKWASDNGHKIVELYVDNVSGSGKAKRPAFEKMLTDAQAKCMNCTGSGTGPHHGTCYECKGTGKGFSMLLFWSLDRLSREGVMATLQHLQRLDKAGVCYRSHTEPYLDSCGIFKDAVLAILAVVAKQERLRISERVKSGLDKARSEGRVGGRPRVVVDDERVAVLRELRDTGFSIKEIAEETGIARSTVHRMLGVGSVGMTPVNGG